MEHVLPVASGGATSADNLALSCFSCNRRKWDRDSGIDPEAGSRERLFDPRRDTWNDHFAWSRDSLTVVGQTPLGRATVIALEMNRERVREIRAADAALGRHPPGEDRRLG